MYTVLDMHYTNYTPKELEFFLNEGIWQAVFLKYYHTDLDAIPSALSSRHWHSTMKK